MTYVQDDWKISPRLTLNLGLRYEIPKPFYDVNLANSTISMTKPNPAAGNLPGVLVFAKDWYKETGNKSFMDTSWKELGPRIGAAYRLDKDTVIRTAYGIFYNAGFGLGNGFRGSTAGYSVNSTAAAPNPWEYKWNIDTPYKVDFTMRPSWTPASVSNPPPVSAPSPATWARAVTSRPGTSVSSTSSRATSSSKPTTWATRAPACPASASRANSSSPGTGSSGTC